jgi:hypothetical protein
MGNDRGGGRGEETAYAADDDEGDATVEYRTNAERRRGGGGA